MDLNNRVINNIRKIYQSLCDNKSKELFCDRILFLLTGDTRYVYNAIFPILQESITEVLSMIHPKKKLIIYGTNSYGNLVFEICKERNFVCFCDDDRNKQIYGHNGRKVISTQELLDSYWDVTVIVMLGEEMYEAVMVLSQFLGDSNVIWLNELLYNLAREQYFPEDIISLEEEVFVDVGCYDFGTSKILLEKCNPKKIYAFEPDAENCLKIKNEIASNHFSEVELFQAGLWKEKSKMFFEAQGNSSSQIVEGGDVQIDVVALDDVIQDKVTFIKMDVEGAELQALAGARRVIQQYKPKLAICIYHKLEDVIDIPLFIQSLVPEYRFYIRQHSFATDPSMGAIEAVLYAVI